MDASFITSDVLPPVKQSDREEVDAKNCQPFHYHFLTGSVKREWWSSDEHIIITPSFPLNY
jgi:hypothetical protein